MKGDIQYPEELHEHHNLQFLPEITKIENVEKLFTKLHDKERIRYSQKNNHQIID